MIDPHRPPGTRAELAELLTAHIRARRELRNLEADAQTDTAAYGSASDRAEGFRQIILGALSTYPHFPDVGALWASLPDDGTEDTVLRALPDPTP